jgi:hypothetical protein
VREWNYKCVIDSRRAAAYTIYMMTLIDTLKKDLRDQPVCTIGLLLTRLVACICVGRLLAAAVYLALN